MLTNIPGQIPQQVVPSQPQTWPQQQYQMVMPTAQQPAMPTPGQALLVPDQQIAVQHQQLMPQYGVQPQQPIMSTSFSQPMSVPYGQQPQAMLPPQPQQFMSPMQQSQGVTMQQMHHPLQQFSQPQSQPLPVVSQQIPLIQQAPQSSSIPAVSQQTFSGIPQSSLTASIQSVSPAKIMPPVSQPQQIVQPPAVSEPTSAGIPRSAQTPSTQSVALAKQPATPEGVLGKSTSGNQKIASAVKLETNTGTGTLQQVIKLECSSEDDIQCPLDDMPGRMYVNRESGQLEAVTLDHATDGQQKGKHKRKAKSKSSSATAIQSTSTTAPKSLQSVDTLCFGDLDVTNEEAQAVKQLLQKMRSSDVSESER